MVDEATGPALEEEQETSTNLVSSTPSLREDTLRKVFKACDQDGNARLSALEMLTFAQHTGFDGSAEDWEQEFVMLCSDQGVDPIAGIDFEAFARLVDDESDSGCFCSDEELVAMLEKLQTVSTHQKGAAMPEPQLREEEELPPPAAVVDTIPAPPAVPSQGEGARPSVAESADMSSALPRTELIRAVFRACDADGDGWLNEHELRLFAGHNGFDGDDEEWASEYSALCAERGGDPTKGVNAEMLARLVDDESDDGCHCTDEELRAMLRVLFQDVKEREAKVAEAVAEELPSQRSKLMKAVFHALDVDGDQRLNMQEMLRFACFCGFDGGDEVWAEEYDSLFAENPGETPEGGISFDFFVRLVDDESDGGSYCTDDELCVMLDKLESNPRDPLVSTIFALLDRDCDSRLNISEFRPFAIMANLDGDAIVRRWLGGAKKAGGIQRLLFAQLLENTASGGRHCTNDELRAFISQLQKEARELDEADEDHLDELQDPWQSSGMAEASPSRPPPPGLPPPPPQDSSAAGGGSKWVPTLGRQDADKSQSGRSQAHGDPWSSSKDPWGGSGDQIEEPEVWQSQGEAEGDWGSNSWQSSSRGSRKGGGWNSGWKGGGAWGSADSGGGWSADSDAWWTNGGGWGSRGGKGSWKGSDGAARGGRHRGY
eukprot:gnl/TRDRNA2_/TRDRNA2_172360_c2_seq1.p1 gnl/TRDRNA2_/TRDRNA2_172360_c2~~gnl/TRDRNA2_/TRDRNA2_172360_c2_seq1.p1  ORF type:complete len:676 (-),score=163.69 gnl/TRDRNA2_/TRDRNA2_172360_c2_seq1:215-2191(-)